MAWFDELFLPPGTTYPIPSLMPPNIPFKYGIKDQDTAGLHSAIYGSPFIPTQFDQTPNTFRPGAQPGQLDVAPKPPLPPAPMMGRAPSPAVMPMPGTLPEGANPPGAMGMGDLGYPGAMTAPTSPQAATPTRKPFDWGADASLWPMLMQAGQGLMQPSYYGFGGQLQQGLQGAADALQREPDRRLKRAQIEDVEAKKEQRRATLAFADTIRDTQARNYMKLGMTKEALARLEKIDPEEQKRVIDFEVAKQNALMPGKIAIAQAGKTDVKVTLPGAETEFAKKRSGVQGDLYKGAIEGARAAETILDNVRMAREVLPQVKTGVGTETIAGLKGVAERLGLQTNADSYQTLIAATKKMAFDTLQQFKGPTTERELLFAILASPNAQMTPDALKRALDAVERSQSYKRRYASEMEKYAGQHGTLNAPGQPSFEEYWQRIVDSERTPAAPATPKKRMIWEGPGRWR